MAALQARVLSPPWALPMLPTGWGPVEEMPLLLLPGFPPFSLLLAKEGKRATVAAASWGCRAAVRGLPGAAMGVSAPPKDWTRTIAEH